jgi:hypothetical protein
MRAKDAYFLASMPKQEYELYVIVLVPVCTSVQQGTVFKTFV